MKQMAKDTNTLIAELVDGLQPVRPMRFSRGFGQALVALGLSLAFVVTLFGLRPDVAAGNLDPVFLLSAGVFLLLGVAAAVTVIMMARPRVGSEHDGWKWAAAMAGLLPASALIIGIGHGTDAFSAFAVSEGLDCLMVGSALGSATFAALVWWLRSGAPTSPERAGLVTGIAAGSFGVFAFSFHCIYNDIVHIGIWHSAVVVLCGIAGRLAVPPLVRW